MASVDLTDLPIARAQYMPLAFGGMQSSPLGGADQMVLRPGSRGMLMVETPPMVIEPHGRRWSALLAKAEYEGALIHVHQPEFDVGAPGLPTVATDTASGRVVPITGATPQYTVRAGQPVSIIVDGQRYFDWITEQVTVASDGTASITLKNHIRKALTAGDVVELAKPIIEGNVLDLEGGAWENDRITSFRFTVRERK